MKLECYQHYQPLLELNLPTLALSLTGYTVLCGSPALFVVGFLDILTLVGAVIYDSSVCTEHLLMVPTYRSERL